MIPSLNSNLAVCALLPPLSLSSLSCHNLELSYQKNHKSRTCGAKTKTWYVSCLSSRNVKGDLLFPIAVDGSQTFLCLARQLFGCSCIDGYVYASLMQSKTELHWKLWGDALSPIQIHLYPQPQHNESLWTSPYATVVDVTLRISPETNI